MLSSAYSMACSIVIARPPAKAASKKSSFDILALEAATDSVYPERSLGRNEVAEVSIIWLWAAKTNRERILRDQIGRWCVRTNDTTRVPVLNTNWDINHGRGPTPVIPLPRETCAHTSMDPCREPADYGLPLQPS